MPSARPLTILEEFLLFALDEKMGEFYPMTRSVMDAVTACAVLMDLMKLGRVDCDLRHLFVVSARPTGDDILDSALQALALDPVRATRAIIDELRFVAEEGEALREHGLHRLLQRGILESDQLNKLRFPAHEDHEIHLTRLRILDVVLGDEAPDPGDVALVALANACGLFRQVLSAREFEHAAPRIAQVARLDILGRVLTELVADIEASIAMASGLR